MAYPIHRAEKFVMETSKVTLHVEDVDKLLPTTGG